MFIFSKLFNDAADPSFWVPILLAIGTILLWTRRPDMGRWLLTVTVGLVVVLSVLPVGMVLNQILEDRFPAPRHLPAHIDGIIVLGGAVQQVTTAVRGQPSLNDSAERMTEFVALARRHPEARLVYSGGSGSIFYPEMKETVVARQFFAQMGLDVSRILFEDRSRNTWENALFSERLVKPKKGETWVLITSAQAMPRAVGCFRRVGWDTIPYPVDYRTHGWTQYHVNIDMAGGFESLWLALHEWIGLAAYRALGRSSALFPAPEPSSAAASLAAVTAGRISK